jgi:hypothetical protein
LSIKKKIQLAAAIGAVCLVLPGLLMAQAAPGPIVPEPSDHPIAPPSRHAEAAKPKPKAIPPRTSLAGAWVFNRTQSDDPRTKIRDTFPDTSRRGYPGQYPGGGYPGGGYPPTYPGGGYPGGGYPYPGGGYPNPGGGYPNGGGSPDSQDSEKLQDLVRPADSVTVAIRDSEIDVTDEHFDKIAFCIDGRHIEKSKDPGDQEVAARWDGHRLVSDEKSPLGGKMSRTFELSASGRQFYETWRIERGKSSPVDVRYVYDAVDPEALEGSNDPGRPILERHDSSGDASDAQTTPEGQTQQAQPPADPNQAAPKPNDAGKNAGVNQSSSPQPPPASEAPEPPDPNRPVLRKRTN